MPSTCTIKQLVLPYMKTSCALQAAHLSPPIGVSQRRNLVVVFCYFFFPPSKSVVETCSLFVMIVPCTNNGKQSVNYLYN